MRCVAKRMFWPPVLLVFVGGLIAASESAAATVEQQLEEEVIGQCCQKGRDYSGGDCGGFPVPIANVSQENQNLCIATIEVCCISARREEACKRGHKKAKEGLACRNDSLVLLSSKESPTCDYDELTMTECCIACKIGSMTSTTSGCTRNAFPSSPYAQKSFVQCCTGQDNPILEDERCPRGFVFNEVLQVCDDVDECYEGTHNCDPQFERCENTLGDYDCQLLDHANATNTCPPGFRFFLISCIDIDECAENLHNCSSHQICANTEGAFQCQKWEQDGPILCPRGYRMDEQSQQCVDINECATSHNCIEGSQRCVNTLGSYNCVRYIPCGTGYTFSTFSGRCEDDDECALGLHNCQSLGPAYFCRNTQGSFRCDRRQCAKGEMLEEASGQCRPVICQAGFAPDDQGRCQDIDECEERRHDCPPDSQCRNTPGSFQCVRQCPHGLRLAEDGQSCVDVDECSEGQENLCPVGQVCTNFLGGFRCDCPTGFQLDQESNLCEDVDECANAFTVCGLDSVCQNSPGSFRCTCKSGFRRASSSAAGEGRDRCVDINECNSIRGICQQRCSNMWGSYRCHCRPGYRLSTDARSCIDINECEEYQDICIGNCQNEPGSYKCTCPPGYILSDNERSCEDIDECEAPGDSPCRGPDQHCFNTRGGFKCVDTSCPPGYEPDGRVTSKRCKLKPEARMCSDPQDVECLRRPLSLSFNFISLVSDLRVVISGPNQMGIDLFTMQSARYYTLTTKFILDVKSVRAAKDVREEVDRSFFRLKTPEPHRAIVALVKPIQGPQDILLELRMDMYNLGRYQASAVANIYVYVTPYRF